MTYKKGTIITAGKYTVEILSESNGEFVLLVKRDGRIISIPKFDAAGVTTYLQGLERLK